MGTAADQPGTGPERDRLLDLLRLVAMGTVVAFHWLVPVVVRTGDGVEITLGLDGQRHAWVTWLLQLMPVFFLVGGAVAFHSLRQPRRAGYGSWLVRRVERLSWPVLPLVLGWTAFGLLLGSGLLPLPATAAGQALREVVKPLWFLPVYLLVTAAAPLAYAAHLRWGWRVVAVLTVAAAGVDLLRFNAAPGWVAEFNTLLVWGLAHQLGICYADRVLSRGRAVGLAAAAVAGLAGLVLLAGYPADLVGLAGTPISNMTPPTLCLAFLALAQYGLVTAFAPVLSRLAALLNRAGGAVDRASRVMFTVYLWHLPAMILVVGVVMLVPGLPLPTPGPGWWATRPLWLLACALPLVLLVPLLARFEWRPNRSGRTGPVRALAALALAVTGVHAAWKYGLDVLAEPWNPLKLLAPVALLVLVPVLRYRTRPVAEPVPARRA